MNPDILNNIEELEKEVQLLKIAALQGNLHDIVMAFGALPKRNETLLALFTQSLENL